jgi:hypothetical protein
MVLMMARQGAGPRERLPKTLKTEINFKGDWTTRLEFTQFRWFSW